MSDKKLSTQDIIRLAAETGARIAIETLEKERQHSQKEIADRRLRNTKLLLRNYRVFRAHVENAVYEVEIEESPQEILEDLMRPGRDGNMFVESIKKSVARTATMVRHIELMIQLYQSFCFSVGTAEDERRWRIVNELYIRDLCGGRPLSISDLAKEEGVVERTIYKDIDNACERIAAFMFGIDGVKRK